MTIWTPRLRGREGPRYLAIADALAEDVTAGRLEPGTRMPTHRDLADTLGVTVGTVSRAYREARSRGLVVGEVGRGTFVRGARPTAEDFSLRVPESTPPDVVDLSLNFNRIPGMQSIVTRSLAALASEPDVLLWLEEYQPQAGVSRHREAAATWLARSGLTVDPDQILITAGAQHAMTVALMASTRPGDAILTAALTYPGIVALARALHLDVHGVAMDEDGITPSALEAACRAHKPRALYCMPTLQNPTTRVMPQARREAIAEVATRHGLVVLEDDVYGFLREDAPPPLIGNLPHRGYFVTGLSKSLAPGLRIGYLVLPAGDRSRFIDTLWATTVMAPPLMAELATRWIEDGTAADIVAGGRVEAAARQEIARQVLSGLRYESYPGALQAWVALPEHWRAGEFVARAAQRGVIVNPIGTFSVTSSTSPAVRIALGGARSRDALRHGLDVVAELAGAGQPRCVV